IRRDLLIDPSGKLWTTCVTPNLVCWFDPHHPEQMNTEPIAGTFQGAIRDARNRLWVTDDERAILEQEGQPNVIVQRQSTLERRRVGPLLSGRDGRLWFIGETVRELTGGTEFHDRQEHERYPPTAGLEDSRGHVWVGTVGQGLEEWISAAQWQRWFPED